MNGYAEDVYRWVDKNGAIHYGDTAPDVKSQRISVKPGEHNEQLGASAKSEHITMTPAKYKAYIDSQKILAARERKRSKGKNKGKNQSNKGKNQGNKGKNQGNKGKSQGNKGKNQGNKAKQSKSDDYVEAPVKVSRSKINLTSCTGIQKAIKQNIKDLKSSDSDVYRTAKSSRKSNKQLLIKHNC